MRTLGKVISDALMAGGLYILPGINALEENKAKGEEAEQ